MTLRYRFAAFRDRQKAEEVLHIINELIKLSLEEQSKQAKRKHVHKSNFK
jgi:hypothetical protein